jgi:hypothetical protein
MVTGSKTFGPSTTLYVEVGGQGEPGSHDGGYPNTPTTVGARCGRHCPNAGDCGTYGDAGTEGAFNGGGRGTQGGSGGGGATDVRTVAGDLQTRMLVAGAGGGCGKNNCERAGGAGGGLAGGDGDQRSAQKGLGATQDAGGAATDPADESSSTWCKAKNGGQYCSYNGEFGKGADYYSCWDTGGGGGGWWGGGSGGGPSSPGGGGSSYYDGMDADKHTQPGVNAGHGYATFIFK